MKIDLKHNVTYETIISFYCAKSKFKIINKDINNTIEIQIDKQKYDLLKKLNYIICWHSDPIWSDCSLSEDDLHKISLSNRKYYISFPILEMDDDMLNKFYGDIFFGYSHVEKELKIVEYKERHFKSGNILIYINGKLIDTQESIFNEKIIYRVI